MCAVASHDCRWQDRRDRSRTSATYSHALSNCTVSAEIPHSSRHRHLQRFAGLMFYRSTQLRGVGPDELCMFPSVSCLESLGVILHYRQTDRHYPHSLPISTDGVGGNGDSMIKRNLALPVAHGCKLLLHRRCPLPRCARRLPGLGVGVLLALNGYFVVVVFCNAGSAAGCCLAFRLRTQPAVILEANSSRYLNVHNKLFGVPLPRPPSICRPCGRRYPRCLRSQWRPHSWKLWRRRTRRLGRTRRIPWCPLHTKEEGEGEEEEEEEEEDVVEQHQHVGAEVLSRGRGRGRGRGLRLELGATLSLSQRFVFLFWPPSFGLLLRPCPLGFLLPSLACFLLVRSLREKLCARAPKFCQVRPVIDRAGSRLWLDQEAGLARWRGSRFCALLRLRRRTPNPVEVLAGPIAGAVGARPARPPALGCFLATCFVRRMVPTLPPE